MSQTRIQPYHDPVLQDFFEWISKNCVKGLVDPASDEKSLFLPYDRLKSYFEGRQYFNLRNILNVVFRDEREIPVDLDEIAKDYSRVLCILLLIGRGHYIRHFVRRDKLRDSFLPFNAKFRPEGFPLDPNDRDEGEFLVRFCEQQWKFCAPIIETTLQRPSRITSSYQ